MIPGRTPIDRPIIRLQRYNGRNVPGWRVSVNYEDGSSEWTWQRWDDAMKWARRLVPDPEPTGHWDPLIRAERLRVARQARAVPWHDRSDAQ